MELGPPPRRTAPFARLDFDGSDLSWDAFPNTERIGA
jgi:hypothetical protein